MKSWIMHENCNTLTYFIFSNRTENAMADGCQA